MSLDPTLLDDLEWRGLLAHSTDLDALRAALGEGSVKYYVGFDPTAPSLHMVTSCRSSRPADSSAPATGPTRWSAGRPA